MEQDCMPCQLRAHRPWYQRVQRYLLGLEMLYAHGFKRDMKWSLRCEGVRPSDAKHAQELVGSHGKQAKQTKKNGPGDVNAALLELLPRCQRQGCDKVCLGSRPYCCHSCEHSAEVHQHCPTCNKSMPHFCCDSAVLYGRGSHTATCVLNNNKRVKLGKSARKFQKGKNKRIRINVKTTPASEASTAKRKGKQKAATAPTSSGEAASREEVVKEEAPATTCGEAGKQVQQKRGVAGKQHQQTQAKELKAFYGGGHVGEVSEIALTNAAMQSLAGNTMSPPVVGSILLLALAVLEELESKNAKYAEAPPEDDECEQECGYDSIVSGVVDYPGTEADRLSSGLTLNHSLAKQASSIVTWRRPTSSFCVK